MSETPSGCAASSIDYVKVSGDALQLLCSPRSVTGMALEKAFPVFP